MLIYYNVSWSLGCCKLFLLRSWNVLFFLNQILHKISLFSGVYDVTALSSKVYGLRMCDYTQHRKALCNNRELLSYVCVDFCQVCLVFHWIYLNNALVVMFNLKRVCKTQYVWCIMFWWIKYHNDVKYE